MNNFINEAEEFIKRYERLYQRPIRSFEKFAVNGFAEYLNKANGVTTPTRAEVTVAIQRDIAGEPPKGISVPDFPLTGDIRTPTDHAGPLKVAFITEDVAHLTGGRYYAWFIAMSLVELGCDVTVYTNQKPVFLDYLKDYKQPEIKIAVTSARQLENLNVIADIYIGSPVSGDIAAANLGLKYGKPAYSLIFDPFPMMDKFKGPHNYPGWGSLAGKLRKSNTKIIALCNETAEYIYPWLNKRKEQVEVVYPCINSRVKNTVPVQERTNTVVFVSRLVTHKKFEHCLEAIKDTDCTLEVISSVDGVHAFDMVKQARMEDRVHFHLKCTEEDKFKMISQARAMINGAIFEGFGMWEIEAIACGTPVVCYDYPTFKEIRDFAKVDNVYLAEWDNPKDLSRKLKQALDEGKTTEPNKAFDFEAITKRMSQIITPEPRIGVITIALNEEQYIGASLRSTIKHPNIKKVAVIEGAVNLFAHACNDKGLSLDNTSSEVFKVMQTDNGNKIVYERFGWSIDKSELRNRGLTLLGKDIDYVLVVDADEVWKPEDLDNLVQAMKDNPRNGVFLFPLYHFWKKPNLIAVGSMWESYLFRCFKYEDKTLHWGLHQAPTLNSKDEYIHKTAGVIRLDNVHVYHYGYLKDQKRILEKLEYYRKRDTTLTVRDTWSNWKKGEETQPTHQGGTTDEFTGTHPEEVRGII